MGITTPCPPPLAEELSLGYSLYIMIIRIDLEDMSLQMLKIVSKSGLPLRQERDKRVRLKLALLIPLLFFFSLANLFAQNTSKQKIAVFVPLYLDSAFDATNSYR